MTGASMLNAARAFYDDCVFFLQIDQYLAVVVMQMFLLKATGACLQEEGFQGSEGGQGRQVELRAAGNIKHCERKLGEVGRQLQQLQVASQGEALQISQLGPGVGNFLQPHPARAVHRHCQRQFRQLQSGRLLSLAWYILIYRCIDFSSGKACAFPYLPIL